MPFLRANLTDSELCVGDVIDPFSDFKACVEENKLTGLMFEELWVDGTSDGAAPKPKPKAKPKKKK